MWKTSANEDAVTIQMDAATCAEQEHFVKTAFGSISVLVSGDQTRPALITYPDVALNYLTCFHGLFLCPEAASLLCENFCIYHINAPGHELGAAAIPSDQSYLTVDDLADQVAEVLDYFELQEVLCMGVTAGAYILTLFATKYRERVAGLVLISPLCRPPSWTEWLCNKLVINLLYFCGMCGVVKEVLLRRYFSQVLHPGGGVEEDPDILEVWGKHLGERHSENVLRLLQGIHMRRDLSYDLKKLKCRTLVFVGEHSPFLDEALHFTRVMDRRYIALVEVQACGSLVTEEIPSAMHVPLECFLMGYGFYRPAQVASHFSSPTSPLSPPCISADLLSPQSLGLKLKPIKTRVVVDD